MTNREFASYDILRLEKLIRDYINIKNNSVSKTLLNNMIIEGKDLLDVLDNLDFETEEKTKENMYLKGEYEELEKENDKLKQNYEKLNENYETLINKLELIVKDSLPEKINNLIKESKENR